MQATIHGSSVLNERAPQNIKKAMIALHGECNNQRNTIFMDESMLSKHMMLIGGTGCGKTNTFMFLVEQLKKQMTPNDVMIVFDTKGDYYKRFYNEHTDCIITTDAQFKENVKTDIWNVFSEVTVDGLSNDKIEANVNEIAWGLFSESIRKNNSNPFFPNAARDLFAAILICLIRMTSSNPDLIKKYFTNRYLRNFFDQLSVENLRTLFKDYPDQQSVLTYIGDGQNSQGLGVIAELQTVVRKIFVGEFAEKGDFSIRELVRKRGARTLFIEYDLDRGSTLTPIYKLLVDLALKEAMGYEAKKRIDRNQKGNVYIFCDEFKLLPDLQHIEDAVNFGRSLGVKFFAGLQSIDQLKENYGEARGKNILGGFSTVISFRPNDEATRQFTVGRYGKNYINEQFFSQYKQQYLDERRLGNVVEDWEMYTLDVGEAIVGLAGEQPFKFKFDEYGV